MSDKKRILLICGSGASSGFMAANMRKASKKMGLNYEIKARSEAELEDYSSDIDALMIGPHLKSEIESIKKQVPNKVKTILMDADYYSTLDGEAAIKHLNRELSSD